MRVLLVVIQLAACGGPNQNQLAESPSAQTRPAPSLAPPASDDDTERHQLNQQFEEQRAAGQAYRETSGDTATPQPLPGQEGLGSGSAVEPKKKKKK